MTAILGISAYYHDSAAALIVDGEIVAAAQEERFTRKKHDASFPQHAVDFCLARGGLTVGDLDHVAFYDKPILKFDRLLETYLSYAPTGLRSFIKAMPLWLKRKLHLRREMDRGLGGAYSHRFLFAEHHESHAASAFFPSPFEEAAVLTIDGVGEWATASFGVGEGNKVRLQREMQFPHSLGLLYTAFTYYCGFRVNSGEYKLMGLAPYGEPRYASVILDELLDLKEDGSFRMDMSCFRYCQGLTMTSPRFHALFGGPPRAPETSIEQRHKDLAASIQQVTEEIMLRMARHVHAVTGKSKLCLAGGVALNCVGNGRIWREGPFEDLWIQPAAGDAGGALGVALLVWYQMLDQPRTPQAGDSQHGSLLGPDFSRDETIAFLTGAGAPHHVHDDSGDLCRAVTALLADGKVVGWMRGRMEFGPRALGARSILGDARSPEMQRTMNLKIKFRESFRPFAPVVLADRGHERFAMDEGAESPYMLLVAPTLSGAELPAITHVDGSARVQTVDEHRNPRFHELLSTFAAETGCPVLINTSFNVRGEPIVCTPEDAYRCFLATNMDALVIDDVLLLKSEQPDAPQHEVDAHLARFTD